MKKDFLRVTDFTSKEILDTFKLALDMKANRAKYSER